MGCYMVLQVMRVMTVKKTFFFTCRPHYISSELYKLIISNGSSSVQQFFITRENELGEEIKFHKPEVTFFLSTHL